MTLALLTSIIVLCYANRKSHTETNAKLSLVWFCTRQLAFYAVILLSLLTLATI